MTRRLMVTGATGYLGGRLVQHLAADASIRVVGTTRRAPSRPKGWPEGADLVRLDPQIADEGAIAEAMSGTDTLIHLALPNEIESANDPVGSLQSGGVGSLKLLRAARAAGCRRFIFLSTIHVYGAPLQGRVVEADSANPTHPYAVVHRTAEDFVRAAHAKRETEGVILRLSNAIGAPAWATVDRWSLIGNDLCRQAVADGRIVLRSSGLQRRDFILLRDAVRAIRHMADVPRDALGDGLFNLGGRMSLRMIDIAEMVARRAKAMFGQDIPITRAPAAAGEAWPELDYSIDRIEATGFSPSPVSALDEEIDGTLRLCKAAFAKEDSAAS